MGQLFCLKKLALVLIMPLFIRKMKIKFLRQSSENKVNVPNILDKRKENHIKKAEIYLDYICQRKALLSVRSTIYKIVKKEEIIKFNRYMIKI